MGRLFRIVEAEALFRYTSADIHVLVDNNVEAAVGPLRSDPTRLEEALRDKRNTELQAVAQLLRTAAQAERKVDVLSIPVPDVFFLLDEGVLRSLYVEYPGHATARNEWQQTRANGQQIGRKRFFAEAYDVPDNLDVYARATVAMREEGIIPHALQTILRSLASDGGK